jgi:heme/copper-type cytochrome/quinol oxidase subunit 2
MPTHAHSPAINGLGVLLWLRTALIVAVGMASLLACDGPQSALDPAGRAAEHIARLFWRMAAGAVLVWLAMAGLTIYAMRGARTAKEGRLAKFLSFPPSF